MSSTDKRPAVCFQCFKGRHKKCYGAGLYFVCICTLSSGKLLVQDVTRMIKEHNATKRS